MGCAASVYAFGGRKKKLKNIPEISFFFFPSILVPVVVTSSDLQTTLRVRGLIPNDLAHTITSLRNQIVFIAHDTRGSAFGELRHALQQYLSLLIGLTKKEHGLQDLVEFKWKALDGTLEISVANSWFELLSVLHMMAMLTLTEATSFLIPKHTTSCDERIVSSDSMREAIDLLLKAAGYLNFCIRDVLVLLPLHIRNKLPESLHESVMESILNQALAQGTELQLGLAVGSQNATLSVKRRLACELLTYLGKAHYCLSEGNTTTNYADGRKHLLFIKWKYLEAKAAAYYYHGLIIDKGTDTEPSCHINAVCCLLAAEELLAESKKACLSFCLSDPVTRAPPPWGAMKYLNKKIPETASKKYQMYGGGYLLEQDNKGVLRVLPDLPEFQLSLKPDDYELPEIHSSWDRGNICGQSLKEHLNDFEDES